MDVLAVVAHPDDEVLGPGGTLFDHARAGDTVRVLCLCDCGRPDEFEASCAELGVEPVVAAIATHDECDQNLDRWLLSELIYPIEQQPVPDLCYLHNPRDLNLDHELAARAAYTAYRDKHVTVVAFETLSSTEFALTPFHPNVFIELDADALDAKLRALRSYQSQLRPAPHPRNPTGVVNHAIMRGTQAGAEYAEAHQLLRQTVLHDEIS